MAGLIQVVYLERLPLKTAVHEQETSQKYNKLLSRTRGPFRTVWVLSQAINVLELKLAYNIWINRENPSQTQISRTTSLMAKHWLHCWTTLWQKTFDGRQTTIITERLLMMISLFSQGRLVEKTVELTMYSSRKATNMFPPKLLARNNSTKHSLQTSWVKLRTEKHTLTLCIHSVCIVK